MNKIIISLIFIILLVNPVFAKTIEENIYERDSIEVPGYNLTLMVIGNKEKSVVMCINNEIYPIEKGVKKTIEDLKIEPTRIYVDYALLKITYTCEDCTCDESCSNIKCFGIENAKQTNKSSVINQQSISLEQQTEKNKISTFSIILLLFVFILLIILLFKKKR
jgi:hypothetical protein